MLSVVPYKLSDERAKRQAPAPQLSPLHLRASQQHDDDEVRGDDDDVEGNNQVYNDEEPEVYDDAHVPKVGDVGVGVGAEENRKYVWTPVQRKSEYRALLRAQQEWNATHNSYAVPKELRSAKLFFGFFFPFFMNASGRHALHVMRGFRRI